MIYTITTSIRKCIPRFLNFCVRLRDTKLTELRSMLSLVILTTTGLLPKCLGQAEPRHKHIMFHAFPEKTWGDKLHLDTPLKHYLKNILAMLWCCLRNADKEGAHLLLNFEPLFTTSVFVCNKSGFWNLNVFLQSICNSMKNIF